MYAYENIRDHMRSRGFVVVGLEDGQGERFCGPNGSSWHCVERGARACDWGTAQYGVEGCWDVYNMLLPYARGTDFVLTELIWQRIFWKNGALIGGIDGHGNHVHSALAVGRALPIFDDPPTPKRFRYSEEQERAG